MRRACRVAVQLRACSASAAGSSRSIVDRQRSTVGGGGMTAKDEKLINRGEFYGVAATSGRKEINRKQKGSSPELMLSRLHDHLRRNYRVSAEMVMAEVVLKLEKGDAALISLLKRAPDRWIPMAIKCCGRALSSISLESRREIAGRLWEQIEKRELPISLESMNAHLRAKLDNNEEWNVAETLVEIEEKRGLVPDQETFHLLLEKLSLTGEVDKCNKISYEMARRGHSPSDAIAHSHIVYANAVRGHKQKVDSLIAASSKFGPEGEALCLGAACVAAAAGGRIDLLRELLRRSVDDNLRLRLPVESVFEIIWVLSEKTGDNQANNDSVIEEILSRTQHPPGFFRFLYREIERHISSSHFRTSMLLLEETMRVKEALKRQERGVFAEQMVGKMCRAMVRSRLEKGLMMEMANRMETTLHIRSRYIHDELMLAALTLKDCDIEDRFSSFSSLLPIVDPRRERPHLILPILAVCTSQDGSPSFDERLKLLYRASSLGYSNLDTLDTNLMTAYLFQPMYKHQAFKAGRSERDLRAMDMMTGIIHSYGITKPSLWRMMHSWWQARKDEEERGEAEMRVRPSAKEIQSWLRDNYAPIFTDKVKETKEIVALTKARLETAMEKGEASMVLSLLSTYGWPEDVSLPSIAPRILDMLLSSEITSADIMKWLTALSREAVSREEHQAAGEGEEAKSALESSHMLRVLRHRVNEGQSPPKELIEMAYELKRLFPNAKATYDSYMDTIPETNRLISACFIFKDGKDGVPMTMDTVDDITELLRTLTKLEITGLSQHGEIVTPFCVLKVLQRFGWVNAVKLWLRFQSSFSFGNGAAVLLAFSLKADLSEKQRKENIQFVLHKAHTCLSPSRIHSLYAAVLVNTSKSEEQTVEYFKQNGSKMQPFDCALAYRLINAIKFPPADKYFIRTFPALCLAHTPLADKKETDARNMLHSSLKFCEAKRMGPLIVEMCELFGQYGVEPDEKERKRIEKTMEEHNKLVNRWIFSPTGLIQVAADQDFIAPDEWKKYVRGGEATKDPGETPLRMF